MNNINSIRVLNYAILIIMLSFFSACINEQTVIVEEESIEEAKIVDQLLTADLEMMNAAVVDMSLVDMSLVDMSLVDMSLVDMSLVDMSTTDQGMDELQERLGTCAAPYLFVETEEAWVSQGHARNNLSLCGLQDDQLGIVSVFEAPNTGLYHFYTEQSVAAQSLSLRVDCGEFSRDLACDTSEASLWFNGTRATLTHPMLAGERVYLLSAQPASVFLDEERSTLTIKAQQQIQHSIEVSEATARMDNDLIQISFHADLDVRQLKAVSVRFTANAEESFTQTFKPWELTYSQRESQSFRARLSLSTPERFGSSPEFEIEVKLLDQSQRENEWKAVEWIEPVFLARDSVCEMDDLFSVCHPDDLCLFVGSVSRCIARSPWQAQELQAFYQAQLNRFGLRLIVENKPDHRPNMLIMNFYDEQGQTILSDIRESHVAVQFDSQTQTQIIEYSGAWIEPSSSIGQQALNLSEIEVKMIDELGQQSQPLRSRVGEPTLVQAGEPCDLLETLNVCPASYTCRDICLPAETDPSECVAQVNAIQLSGEEGTIEGDLSNSVISGSWCNTEGYNDYYKFTAPRSSFYSFSVRSRAFDPVISIQSQCHTQPASSDCNDDGYYGNDAVINQRLEAGESVYLRVGSYVHSGFGPYRLRHIPCHIDDIDCY